MQIDDDAHRQMAPTEQSFPLQRGNFVSSTTSTQRNRNVNMSKRQCLSRIDYASYIISNDWMLVKKRYLNSNLPKDCYCCGKLYGTYRIEFHHRTYKRLGRERLIDIVPVCRDCHQLIHDTRSSLSIDLWSSTKKVRKKRRGKQHVEENAFSTNRRNNGSHSVV